MGFSCLLCFLSLILAVAATHVVGTIETVKFNVLHFPESNAGGKLFSDKMGVEYAKEFMRSTAETIWEFIFWQSVDIGEKVKKINLFIDHKPDVLGSYYFLQVTPFVYEVHLSGEHIEKYEDCAKEEIEMILIYEIALILQYTGGGRSPFEVRKGLAGYMVLRFGHKPSRWANYGAGDRWNLSPDVTAQFFWYCSEQYSNFIELLNKKMKFNYEDSYFVEVTHKTMDVVWKEYKEEAIMYGYGN